MYSGSTRMFPIANGYSSSLFNGDVVGLGNGTTGTAGTVITTGYTATVATANNNFGLGVFVGCEYSTTGGPIYGKNRYQFWNAGVSTNDAQGYVVDDPLAYFRVAVLTQGTTLSNTVPGTTIGYMNPYFVGSNAVLVTGTSGSTATGDSAQGITGNQVASGTAGNVRLTTSAPFRIIQVVPDTAYSYTSASTSTTSSGTSMTISAADTNIKPGMQFIAVAANGTYVSGCAPGNYNTVVTNAGSTTIVLSGSIGASLSGATLTFVGYPEVIVGWNFGYQVYQNATGSI